MKKDINSQRMLPGACSCMTLTSKSGKHYWFRTCDVEGNLWEDGAHVVRRSEGEEITYCDGKRAYCQYSYVGMTYNAIDTWLLDGVNERGLAGGLLMLQEGTSVDKASGERDGYVGMELVTKILASCKDVKEVIALAEEIQILNVPYGDKDSVAATMHYFFADTNGDEVILEAANPETPGIPDVYKKENILGVMTNSPSYKEQLQNLAWFMSQSQELKQGLEGKAITELTLDGRCIRADNNSWHISVNGTFPASYSSYDRFIRLTILKYLNDSGNGFEDEKMLALGSGIMNTVCEPHTKGVFHYTKIENGRNIIGQRESYTQYVCMYDLENGIFWKKKFDQLMWEQNSIFDNFGS